LLLLNFSDTILIFISLQVPAPGVKLVPTGRREHLVDQELRRFRPADLREAAKKALNHSVRFYMQDLSPLH
jgi:hypothetical protein